MRPDIFRQESAINRFKILNILTILMPEIDFAVGLHQLKIFEKTDIIKMLLPVINLAYYLA
jgi:hypothetical protein